MIKKHYQLKSFVSYGDYICQSTDSFVDNISIGGVYILKRLINEQIDINEYIDKKLYEKTELIISFFESREENDKYMLIMDQKAKKEKILIEKGEYLVYNQVLKSTKPEEDYKKYFKFISLKTTKTGGKFSNIINGLYIERPQLNNISIKRIFMELIFTRSKNIPILKKEEGLLELF